MEIPSRRIFGTACAAAIALALISSPLLAKGGKAFLDSDDAKEANEPQKFLPDYDKLTKGKDADWVYFPEGSLKKYRTVSVKEFVENGRHDSKDAAREGKEYMEQWLEKAGFKLADKGAELSFEGNVFSASEHRRGAGWTPWGVGNSGVGLEVLVKDGSGKVVGEIRHKGNGSSLEDAVENALEEVAKAVQDGR